METQHPQHHKEFWTVWTSDLLEKLSCIDLLSRFSDQRSNWVGIWWVFHSISNTSCLWNQYLYRPHEHDWTDPMKAIDQSRASRDSFALVRIPIWLDPNWTVDRRWKRWPSLAKIKIKFWVSWMWTANRNEIHEQRILSTMKIFHAIYELFMLKKYFNDNADDKWKLNLNYHIYIVKVNVFFKMKNEWQEVLYDHI